MHRRLDIQSGPNAAVAATSGRPVSPGVAALAKTRGCVSNELTVPWWKLGPRRRAPSRTGRTAIRAKSMAGAISADRSVPTPLMHRPADPEAKLLRKGDGREVRLSFGLASSGGESPWPARASATAASGKRHRDRSGSQATRQIDRPGVPFPPSRPRPSLA